MQEVGQRSGLILQALVLAQMKAVHVNLAHGLILVLPRPWRRQRLRVTLRRRAFVVLS